MYLHRFKVPTNINLERRLAKMNKPVSNTPPALNEKAMKLVAEMLAGEITDIRPQLDFTTEMGFAYPAIEQTLKVNAEEAVSILESLAAQDILKEDFFDRLLHCPRCRSVHLRPSTHCPQCGSGDFARGIASKHVPCEFSGLEEEFVTDKGHVCPKCGLELRTSFGNYHSLGLMYKCHNCYEVFSQPEIQWRCLKCGTLTPQNKVSEVNIYCYRLDEAKRGWLEFELKPKSQLIEFLKKRGYEVTENAIVKGRSGAEHRIDILAARDDGIVTHDIAIGVKVAGDEIGLGEMFDFDDKVYDIGIHDKILVALPGLRTEAEEFARRQRIKVLEVKDLETLLASAAPQPDKEIEREPFEFKSKSQLIQYLKRRGYEVKENAEVKGRSGAAHNLDILAARDDGIIIQHIAIGIEVSGEPLGLDKVFDFDNKAYDIGTLDKAFIAVPGLTHEARQFAQRQRIRVFEVKELG